MRTLPVKLPANSSRMIWDMRLPRPLMDDPCGCFAHAQLIVNGRVVSENFHFPAEFKDIKWPVTGMSARVIRISKSKADIAIKTESYARMVRIENLAGQSRFSDNFFDIPPGEERIVRVAADMPTAKIRISAANMRKTAIGDAADPAHLEAGRCCRRT